MCRFSDAAAISAWSLISLTPAGWMKAPTGATAVLVAALFAEAAVPGIPVEPATGLTLRVHCLCLLATKCHVPGPLCSPGRACLGCVVECLTCPTPALSYGLPCEAQGMYTGVYPSPRLPYCPCHFLPEGVVVDGP